MVPINYLAVLASMVIMMVLGGLWYGPLFGKKWMTLMGFRAERGQDMQAAGMKAVWKSYVLMGIGALLMSYVLAHVVIFANTYEGTSGVSGGLMSGFWVWLGFIAPPTMGMVLWEGKPWKLWMIVAGYWLAGLLIVGTLLSVWV